jgi:NTP pyrophosphatase (non-canonical NTP hydrolase)
MDKTILQKALDTFGVHRQIDKVIEESVELVQAVLKAREYQETHDGDYTPSLYHAIKTELADVYVTAEYVKMLYNISERELQEEIDFKVNRLKERMEVANEKLSESR